MKIKFEIVTNIDYLKLVCKNILHLFYDQLFEVAVLRLTSKIIHNPNSPLISFTLGKKQ